MSNYSQMAIGSRIFEALKHLGRKQSWLCETAGIDTATLSAIIRRDSKRTEFSGQIADALGVYHRWLQTGEGEMWKNTAGENRANYQVSNAHPAPPPRKMVPVISIVRASEFADIHCDFEPGEGIIWETPDHKIGPRAWAHIVDGPSMDDGTAQGFPHGSLIFVDPDIAPSANAYVIAKHVGDQTATFKQLVTDGGRWYLRPLNPQFKIIEIDDPKMRVIAVVTEARSVSRKLA